MRMMKILRFEYHNLDLSSISTVVSEGCVPYHLVRVFLDHLIMRLQCLLSAMSKSANILYSSHHLKPIAFQDHFGLVWIVFLYYT